MINYKDSCGHKFISLKVKTQIVCMDVYCSMEAEKSWKMKFEYQKKNIFDSIRMEIVALLFVLFIDDRCVQEVFEANLRIWNWKNVGMSGGGFYWMADGVVMVMVIIYEHIYQEQSKCIYENRI